MRPIKELFIEEYWNIGFRKFSEDDTVVNAGGVYSFDILKATDRYWYADPFLFEEDDRIYLFVEMFDNKTEKGLIGVSEWDGGRFTEPRAVLEEPFHLSYPYVFEKNGQIYMMPETQQDGCIQLYESTGFPDKWEKRKVLVKINDAVDTVIIDNYLVTSVIDSAAEKTTHIELYNAQTGEAYFGNPICQASSDSRGAGRPFNLNGRVIRPAQDCSGGIYGRGLYFYDVTIGNGSYTERKISHLDFSSVKTKGLNPTGIHTYARCRDIEIVDIKSERFNPRRLLWILSKKI